MNNHVKLKGRLANYFNAPLRLGIFLILVDLIIYFVSWPSGLLLTVFTAVYFLIVGSLYINNRSLLTGELVSFATEYGQIQRKLLRELGVPYAVLDETGRIIWTNEQFERITHREKGYRRSITTIFPALTRDNLPSREDEKDFPVEYENSYYTAHMTRIPLDDMAANSDIIDASGYQDFLIALYLFDETAVKLALQEVDDQSVVVGFIYMDDYEEALESIEDVRRSLLIALIDRKVAKYVSSVDGVCAKIEKDKYFVVMRKKSLLQLQNAHFELLGDVKTVNIGNEMSITISIGIGMNGLSYAQNYEFARNAVDLALGRGGDQAVIKTPDNTVYYGGKTQQVEKSTRVKARVKAQAMKEIISTRDKVYIMGHRLGDVDSFGSAVGIYRIARTMNKEAHIVINEVTNSLKPIMELFTDNPEYPEDLFYTSPQAVDTVSGNSALVVVDVNKPSITECPELLRLCKSIIVLDHHRQGTEVIENATLSYVEAYASSACEMVSEILQYIGENIHIRQEEADAMYAGIVVDTNNFVSKTGVRTFEAAAFLRRNGADVTRVRKLFREDAGEYKARADAVSQAEIYRDNYAISVCVNHEIESPTVVGAQAANELLNIKGVKASFILTEYQNQIFISARSIDEVNVQVIMERLGGGGHMNIAGCQMEEVSIEEAGSILKRTLDDMIAEGEIS
ncbi:DHH family phosphoesterase [Lachnoclostridium sp. Marseille-P6806]|uniref:DHH family phosphoesterase n=1 Tax=Lachnoclostridium sp. Marseille-P6806 TaxID=2364793 RepID=UPI00103171EB|nr:DHH family phosphoesterase [Lachnoclostridium sp. Marseille-P6806]